MATPNVAGLAALVASINPDLTGKQIKDLILNNEHFFIQESAFKRIDDYFHMEFKEPSLISFAKLLQSEIEDFGNIDSLPADAKLFLTKAKKWIEESSEIEVLPPPVSGYAILFRRANHLSISQMRFSK